MANTWAEVLKKARLDTKLVSAPISKDQSKMTQAEKEAWRDANRPRVVRPTNEEIDAQSKAEFDQKMAEHTAGVEKAYAAKPYNPVFGIGGIENQRMFNALEGGELSGLPPDLKGVVSGSSVEPMDKRRVDELIEQYKATPEYLDQLSMLKQNQESIDARKASAANVGQVRDLRGFQEMIDRINSPGVGNYSQRQYQAPPADHYGEIMGQVKQAAEKQMAMRNALNTEVLKRREELMKDYGLKRNIMITESKNNLGEATLEERKRAALEDERRKLLELQKKGSGVKPLTEGQRQKIMEKHTDRMKELSPLIRAANRIKQLVPGIDTMTFKGGAKENKIPGIGILESKLPSTMQKDAVATEVNQIVYEILNKYLKQQTGTAVSPGEYARLQKAWGTAPLDDEGAFQLAFSRFNKELRAITQENEGNLKRAGLYDEYKQTGETYENYFGPEGSGGTFEPAKPTEGAKIKVKGPKGESGFMDPSEFEAYKNKGWVKQ